MAHSHRSSHEQAGRHSRGAEARAHGDGRPAVTAGGRQAGAAASAHQGRDRACVGGCPPRHQGPGAAVTAGGACARSEWRLEAVRARQLLCSVGLFPFWMR